MENSEKILVDLQAVSLEISGKSVLKEICMTMIPDQAWGVHGYSGSGKTIFGKLLAGLANPSAGLVQFHPSITSKRAFVSQQHDFRHLSGGSRAYYQQRFDANYNHHSPVLGEFLENEALAGNATKEQLDKIIHLLQMDPFLERHLIELSNGEGKRLQLALALLKQPRLLVLDNPFSGLDIQARGSLHQIINELYLEGILIVIITPENELPHCITHVVALKNGRQTYTGELKGYRHRAILPPFLHLQEEDNQWLFSSSKDHFQVAVEMVNIIVSYGEKIVLKNINWRVNRGERWALTGPNGAGKSTLLSLIMADNHQGYFNELYLFDKKRGSGESIWDIKRKIGYVSPELHLFFQRAPSHAVSVSYESGILDLGTFSRPRVTCFEAIASGFNDQIGSSKSITSLQVKKVERWMELMGIAEFKNENFALLSLGNQRLVLLARALVKDAPMLILDEPCQGLDAAQTETFKTIVDFVCLNFNKTLIYVSHYPEDIPGCVDRFYTLPMLQRS